MMCNFGGPCTTGLSKDKMCFTEFGDTEWRMPKLGCFLETELNSSVFCICATFREIGTYTLIVKLLHCESRKF
jgi:hypothetical protein